MCFLFLHIDKIDFASIKSIKSKEVGSEHDERHRTPHLAFAKCHVLRVSLSSDSPRYFCCF